MELNQIVRLFGANPPNWHSGLRGLQLQWFASWLAQWSWKCLHSYCKLTFFGFDFPKFATFLATPNSSMSLSLSTLSSSLTLAGRFFPGLALGFFSACFLAVICKDQISPVIYKHLIAFRSILSCIVTTRYVKLQTSLCQPTCKGQTQISTDCFNIRKPYSSGYTITQVIPPLSSWAR